jgi:hypothetical protein
MELQISDQQDTIAGQQRQIAEFTGRLGAVLCSAVQG